MSKHIIEPTKIKAEGLPSKLIEEFIGRANTENDDISIARMTSPKGWSEPGQKPEFDEFTVVLKGAVHVELEGDNTIVVREGEVFHAFSGEWVRYSTPDGAEYIAVCLPAFSQDTVHREE